VQSGGGQERNARRGREAGSEPASQADIIAWCHRSCDHAPFDLGHNNAASVRRYSDPATQDARGRAYTMCAMHCGPPADMSATVAGFQSLIRCTKGPDPMRFAHRPSGGILPATTVPRATWPPYKSCVSGHTRCLISRDRLAPCGPVTVACVARRPLYSAPA
jgi:hypothetical protein